MPAGLRFRFADCKHNFLGQPEHIPISPPARSGLSPHLGRRHNRGCRAERRRLNAQYVVSGCGFPSSSEKRSTSARSLSSIASLSSSARVQKDLAELSFGYGKPPLIPKIEV
jgi:hypothetical protein